MSNCQTKKLGEVCEILAGGSAPQGVRFFENGKYPFFRTSDVGAVHLSDNLCAVRDYLNGEGNEAPRSRATRYLARKYL